MVELSELERDISEALLQGFGCLLNPESAEAIAQVAAARAEAYFHHRAARVHGE